ncbi:Ig-like domain-containing protein [Mesorhizobium sp. 1B3]|uniref:Ig-like domain-containing protein n=1 Tax=Mesorhizobium sp. 1B3 TaxID=3243599 RepID=UPI003D99C8F6
MVVNPWKAFLFLAGGTVAAGGTAYVSGALDPYLYTRSGQLVAVPQPDAATTAGRLSAPEQPATPAKPSDKQTPPASGPVVPAFDVVRVEPDGSVVVAGKADPEASVEMLVGEQVVGTAKADASGDFAIVLDKPLKPGDYQFTLRSTAPGASPLASAETAIVSVPETSSGQVLAMVETPGRASEVVTAPNPAPQATAPLKQIEPSRPEEPAKSSQSAPTSEPPAQQQAAAAPSDATAAAKPEKAVAPAVAVQAVEIEGKKIFVAGRAEPGRSVRVYANEMLLGEAKAAPNGRFLVEAERELPVGNYMIRADVLGDDGLQVMARAAVPFEREPGETIAAVAPTDEPAQAAPPVHDPNATLKAVQPAREAIVSPEATAPKLEAVASAVIIRRGDSLWRISRRVYGRGIRYSTIYLANQDQIANPDRIWPGQVFSVPERTKEGETADMKAMGEQMTAKPSQ